MTVFSGAALAQRAPRPAFYADVALPFTQEGRVSALHQKRKKNEKNPWVEDSGSMIILTRDSD